MSWNDSDVSPTFDSDLWSRIEAHDFEPQGRVLTFTDRLARDHGWTTEEARSVINEYRRFCFLAATSKRELTPSQEVDEVWHLHLTFSQDYWDRWCHSVLRQALHHSPTQGGQPETSRFAEQYACTLAHYESVFGPPHPVYWPGTTKRFRRQRYLTVDRDRSIIISWPRCIMQLIQLFCSMWRSSVTRRKGGMRP